MYRGYAVADCGDEIIQESRLHDREEIAVVLSMIALNHTIKSLGKKEFKIISTFSEKAVDIHF